MLRAKDEVLARRPDKWKVAHRASRIAHEAPFTAGRRSTNHIGYEEGGTLAETVAAAPIGRAVRRGRKAYAELFNIPRQIFDDAPVERAEPAVMQVARAHFLRGFLHPLDHAFNRLMQQLWRIVGIHIAGVRKLRTDHKVRLDLNDVRWC